MSRDLEPDAPTGLNDDASATADGRLYDEVVRDSGFGAAASSSETAIEVVVKWFRSDKGYGFVELPGGLRDAFLHVKALRAFGRETASTGAKLRVLVDEGSRGTQVTRVIDIDESCAAARGFSNGLRAFPRHGRDLSSAVELTGRVKWFDASRGFGFIAGDDFGRDVFVHSSRLGPAGLSNLVEGQAVTMRVVETAKGREAVEISL